jgi:hypothetical protein
VAELRARWRVFRTFAAMWTTGNRTIVPWAEKALSIRTARLVGTTPVAKSSPKGAQIPRESIDEGVVKSARIG